MAPFDLLAIAAHPDDAEIGCGGALRLAVEQGRRVAVVDLTRGEQSTRGTVTQRMAEAEASSAVLGLHARHNLGLPDSQLGAHPSHRLELVALLRALRPQVVLAPYWEDRHPDHSAAGKLAREACFFAGVARVGQGQPHSPARLYFYQLHHPFPPSFVLDISGVWDYKMAAIRAFTSQFGSVTGMAQTAISGGSFLRAVEARAVLHGAMIGALWGEAFLAAGPIALDSLPGLSDSPPGFDSPLSYASHRY